MVFNNDNTIVVSCDCGCDNSIFIKEISGNLYISFSSSDFYNKQRNIFNSLFDKSKKLINRKNNKILLNEILVTKDDLVKLLNLLKDFKLNDEPINNESYIALKPVCYFGKCEGYALELITKQNITTYLTKEYRNYELELNQASLNKFICLCKKMMLQIDEIEREVGDINDTK